MRHTLPSFFGSHALTTDKNEPFRALRRQMDEMISDFSKGFSEGPAAGGAEFMPRMDISESDDAFQITAELPGMDEKDIEVTVSDNRLTVKGEKTSEKKDEDERYHLVERSYGSILRTIDLPSDVMADKIEAEFDKGVLKISVPKSPQAVERTKKIEIKSK